MPVTAMVGWGYASAALQVAANIAGVQTVVANVGIALQMTAGKNPIRLSSLGVKVLPIAGGGDGPTTYRLLVIRDPLPNDVTTYQALLVATGSGNAPKALASNIGQIVFYDLLIDGNFDAFPPSQLYVQHDRAFPDAGPMVGAGETLTVLVVPMIGSQGATLGDALAQLSVYAYGVEVLPTDAGGTAMNVGSLPRFGSTR